MTTLLDLPPRILAVLALAVFVGAALDVVARIVADVRARRREARSGLVTLPPVVRRSEGPDR